MASLRPDSYKRIRNYAKKYAATVAEKTDGKGLAKPTPKDNFAVLMEKKEIMTLLEHAKCVYLAAIIGIANEGDGKGDQVTVSLLIADDKGKVIDEHWRHPVPPKKDPLPGQEVWPIKRAIEDLDTFLPEPEY